MSMFRTIAEQEEQIWTVKKLMVGLLAMVAPQVEPDDTVEGLYWQIDNYIAGVDQNLKTCRYLLWKTVTTLKECQRHLMYYGQSRILLDFIDVLLNDPEVKRMMEKPVWLAGSDKQGPEPLGSDW